MLRALFDLIAVVAFVASFALIAGIVAGVI